MANPPLDPIAQQLAQAYMDSLHLHLSQAMDDWLAAHMQQGNLPIAGVMAGLAHFTARALATMDELLTTRDAKHPWMDDWWIEVRRAVRALQRRQGQRS